MSLFVGVGASGNSGVSIAIDEAFQQATASLSGHAPTQLILLCSPTTYDQSEVLKYLQQKSPQSSLVGCSTSGEITSTAGPQDNSLALMALYSDTDKFISGVGRDIKADPRQSGKALANDIIKNNQGQAPKAALIFPDGLAGNGADIVRGILDVYGENFTLAGGSAGDDFQFKQTYQYYGQQLLTNSVVGIGLVGNLTCGVGVRHGWISIGNPRTVTKAKANIVYEMDGKPAIQIYEDQFGKDLPLISNNEPFAKLAITYPLGILQQSGREYLIRDPLSVDENGAITCAAEVPEGSQVLIMIGSREDAINAAKQAAQSALNGLSGKTPKAAFLFNCIARKKLLGSHRKEEIDAITSILGPVPMIGFYTYGEQAPLGGEILTCSFHNETDVIFLITD